jgi:two-component system, LuxR family, response regulator FixJ
VPRALPGGNLMVQVSTKTAKGHQATICVVESNAEDRAALVQLLSHLEHEVVGFESAEALLRSLENLSMAVLVAGLELPGLNGLELLHELRERGRQAPTILIAGETNVATAVEAIRAGAVDFIQRPVIDRILLRRVRDALDQVTT